MMEQRGRDEQGILGFLSADIQKELRRGKRLVSINYEARMAFLILIYNKNLKIIGYFCTNSVFLFCAELLSLQKDWCNFRMLQHKM